MRPLDRSLPGPVRPRHVGLLAAVTYWLVTAWVSLTTGDVPLPLAVGFVATWVVGFGFAVNASRREARLAFLAGVGLTLGVVLSTAVPHATSRTDAAYQEYVLSLPGGALVLAAGMAGILLATYAVPVFVLVVLREEYWREGGPGRSPEEEVLSEEEYAQFDSPDRRDT